MRLRKTMRRAAHASPAPLSVERSSGSRSNTYRARQKRRPRSGFGGLAPRPLICPRSGAPTWLGSRWSIPFASSSKRSTGRRPDCAHRALLTAADRWTWLLILAYVQLRLARDTVVDVRLPWQPPLPVERRTPARVRRGFSQVLMSLGSPASVPKPCGRSPGRPRGKRSPPAQRFPAVKLTP